jgi:serine/threonine protein kinase
MTVSATPPRVFLGKYHVLRPLGEGGMARVYLALDRTSGKEVVVKVMHDHLARNPAVRQHFGREFELMKRFRHPGAVAWLDGSIDGVEPCLVMEYVRGVNLEEHAQPRRRFPPHRVGLWLGQLCQVLHAAHGAGILHRDLSLANVMLVDPETPRETVKVLDFGLARLTGAVYVPLEKLKGTAPAAGGGTPDYICPEQVRGDAVDARGDLYSVGVILFRLLTGKFPFEQFTQASDLLLAHVQLPVPRFALVGVRDVPAPIEVVVQHCLSKYPAERPPGAKELAELFGKALGVDIAPADAFPAVAAAPVEAAPPVYNPRHRIDLMDAFMPEQIAVIKLRGFVGEMGGDVVASDPGHIRLRIPDRRDQPTQESTYNWWSMSKKAPPPTTKYLFLDLYMSKKQVGQRNLVEIAVVMNPRPNESLADARTRQGFAERVCRELRAFLLIGF